MRRECATVIFFFVEHPDSRREQYYWVRYWYWVILGCFKNIAIGIVKSLSKYWYWYWVLLRAFQTIGIGIGYC